MGFEIGAYASKLSSTRPRTIETVTEEILDIKQRVTEDFMELGQRLCEAKELLPHGEWLPWLEGRVQFSERTAQKFMQLAREYEANPKLASDLGSEKAFALLALPKEEREQIARDGMVVDGKTKPAADLTKREIQQAVKERKVSFNAKEEAQAYLEARAEEDAEYRDMLHRLAGQLRVPLAFAPTRQAGISALKLQLSSRGGFDGEVYYRGNSTAWEMHRRFCEPIKRTWTEVWDMLAVMALQEVARKPAEPEGQLTIAGYMPGGTNPGRESGLCVCMMQLDPEKDPTPMLLFWDGVAGCWMFKHGGATVDMEPLGWMRLPEWRK